MSQSRRIRPSTPVVVALVAIATALALALAAGARPAAARTIWLCHPGMAHDPCTPGLSTPGYSPTLQPLGVTHPRPQRTPAADCFYVYPTVSDQKTTLSNRQ